MGRRGGLASGHGAFLIAATYVGTIVGAGFASGQEVLQFFTAFGRAGVAGLVMSAALFALFGIRVLHLGRLYGARSYRPLLHHAWGPKLGSVLDGLVILFLLATAAAMASGAGATGLEQYGWARGWGSGLLVALTVLTVLAGIEGVVRSMGVFSPLLVVMVLFISVYALQVDGGLAGAFGWEGDRTLSPVPVWYGAAPLYVAYNLLLSIPVLAYLGATAQGDGAIRWGAILGAVGLGLGALAIHFAVAVKLPEAAGVDIPILNTAQTLPSAVPMVYTALMFAEIYTTAVATLFGFAARVAKPGGWGFRLAVVGGGMVAFLAGQFRFADLVGTLYPVMGVVGAIMLLGLLRPANPSRLGRFG